MKTDLIDLYSEYILSSYGKITATGLAELTDGRYSHDQITRLLSRNEFTSQTLWTLVKKVVRQIEQEDGVLVFDDTIQEKPYSTENDLIAWHYDHVKQRNVKGINLLNCLYHAGGTSIPVAYELIHKDVHYTDPKTGTDKRRSKFTKNEYFRNLLHICCMNQLRLRYVLADSWFCSNENMNYIKLDCRKDFILAAKSNRLVFLSEEEKANGRSQRIDSVDFPEEAPVKAWIPGVKFPVQLFKQVFKNKDNSTGTLYLVCSDLTCDGNEIATIYKKRWKVELFHKTLKSHASMAKSPAHTPKTQGNHLFLSIYAAFRLETLSLKLNLNHFQIRADLYMTAVRSAFNRLRTLQAAGA